MLSAYSTRLSGWLWVITEADRPVTTLLEVMARRREIAAGLSLSERTVANHVRHILTKPELPSRTAAATDAVRHGLA